MVSWKLFIVLKLPGFSCSKTLDPVIGPRGTYIEEINWQLLFITEEQSGNNIVILFLFNFSYTEWYAIVTNKYA
jgi:hypothetical protein